jgi:hypothetical protein
MHSPEVVILGAARTPIGRYGGSFRDVHPAELGLCVSGGMGMALAIERP